MEYNLIDIEEDKVGLLIKSLITPGHGWFVVRIPHTIILTSTIVSAILRQPNLP